MKHEIKAKTNVQLLCFGKILRQGETYLHEGAIPNEVMRAKQQGLVTVTEIAEKPIVEPAKVAPKPVPKETPKVIPKKEEKKEEVPEEVLPEEKPAAEPEKPVTDVKVDLEALGTMNRDELEKIAVELGLDPKTYSNITKLRTAIRNKVQ